MHFPPVLVLGATGRIGAVLRQAWAPGRARWQARRAPGSSHHSGDWAVFDPLAEPAALSAAASGCTAILCLAGITPARIAAGDDPGLNLALARAAVQAGADSGSAVLLASSAAVYGAQAGMLAEDAPPAPASDYGRAKAEMEAGAARLGADLGVRVCSLRIGNIAGLDAILGGWRPGFALDVFADGRSPRRSYVGPQTLARVLDDLVMAAGDLPPVLNVAAPGAVEMGVLLDAAGLGWQPRPAPPGAIPEVRLDVSALRGFTRIGPRDSLPETLVAEWRRAGTLPQG